MPGSGMKFRVSRVALAEVEDGAVDRDRHDGRSDQGDRAAPPPVRLLVPAVVKGVATGAPADVELANVNGPVCHGGTWR